MQVTHDEVRTRFKAFAGDVQFHNFVVQVHRFAGRRGRLRFWQDKLWNAFLVENQDCGIDHDELCTTFRVCELHGCELQSTSVPVVDGCVVYSRDYTIDSASRFPHATREFVSTEGAPKYSNRADIFYCNKCDETREASRWRTEAGYQIHEHLHEQSEELQQGITRALEVARSGIRSEVSEADAKLLGFFLRDGECDARIADPVIEVRFSWLQKRIPSTYFLSLGPGLISQLMDLGGVSSVVDATEFSVGPGSAGTGNYRFSFAKKWIWIHCADEEILIRVRDQRQDLEIPLRNDL